MTSTIIFIIASIICWTIIIWASSNTDAVLEAPRHQTALFYFGIWFIILIMYIVQITGLFNWLVQYMPHK